MGHSKSTLPILPLQRGSVLLPGVTLRIPVTGRSDIPPLLTSAYSQARASNEIEVSLLLGCVPLNSPHLSPAGQKLITGKDDQAHQEPEAFDRLPGEAPKEDIFLYGTVGRIVGLQGTRSELALVVEGVRRFKINKFNQSRPFFEANVTYLDEEAVDLNDPEIQALCEQLQKLSAEFFGLTRLPTILPGRSTIAALFPHRLEMLMQSKNLEQAGVLADCMTDVANATLEEKLLILSTLDIKKKVIIVSEVLSRLVLRIKIGSKIRRTSFPNDGMDVGNISRLNRESMLRRAMSGIGGWAGSGPPILRPRGSGGESDLDELGELNKKLEAAKLTPEAKKVADRELKRLRMMNPQQAEYGVCRTYLETLSEIPWSASTEDRLGMETLRRARKQLDDDHYGLEKIKKRLLEYLAVLRLKQAVNADLEAQIAQATQEQTQAAQDQVSGKAVGEEPSSKESTTDFREIQVLKSQRRVDKSPILLLVGPPGTGKTSLAKSVATALGRKFHRISLGGVRDESEIRGHRRTYVAAMPGVIVNGLKKVGVSNPVFLLDEIDKVGGSNFHGDPSAAMLEVLDPEQNYTFTDHYVNIPIDLSKVLFIATANSLDTIPPPLLDRMETISLSGYTSVEKRHIANRHLIPKQITTNGLRGDLISFSDSVVDTIIASYTRESGVRNLEREIGSVCRSKAVEYADAQDASPPHPYNSQVSLAEIDSILGIPQFEEEIAEKNTLPGIVTGLVAYSTGGQGSILFIEVADMPGTGRVQLTGKLGDVLKESVEVALTWVKAHAFELGLTPDASEDIMRNRSVHVHCPSGAIPKDGPSAGLAHTIALISLFSGKAVPSLLAMTGEVSLRGRVMPVGGIKEKLIGALRAGSKSVLLPVGNRKDARDLPREVLDGLEIVYVGHIWEAIKHVWPEARWPGEQPLPGIESRL